MSTEAIIIWVPEAASRPYSGVLNIELSPQIRIVDLIQKYSESPPRRTGAEILADIPAKPSKLQELIGCPECPLLQQDAQFLDEPVRPGYLTREENSIKVGCTGTHFRLVAQALCVKKFESPVVINVDL